MKDKAFKDATIQWVNQLEEELECSELVVTYKDWANFMRWRAELYSRLKIKVKE